MPETVDTRIPKVIQGPTTLAAAAKPVQQRQLGLLEPVEPVLKARTEPATEMKLQRAAPEEERDIKRYKVPFNPIQRYNKEKPLLIRKDTIDIKKKEP